MQQSDFEALVVRLCADSDLPTALATLKNADDEQVAEAAQDLTGQFTLAEVEGEERIYHVTFETNPQGGQDEFFEYIMNKEDDVIRFIAWFFDTQFGVKRKDVYQAAGKTYQQPKRA
ncbi:hypothetical protein [Vibrio palustris]|uniref:Uncharacterized protein n=1 Tax=Vibrio palustris TaxID=1918946 RepID=A0A1R4B676_9VIBR|nr:hypothetical protein [Vibrio palustris]SJL84420.1 hypothetical protein VPAL9027_02404 [Vibrio palustris]